MCNFWAQNGPYSQKRIFFFSKNLLMGLVSLIHAYVHDKNQSEILIISEILMIKEYWNLIGSEPFLVINWELYFSQRCSFFTMLMNHKNFPFTQIPNKTYDAIFLKSPKNHGFGSFLTIIARWGFFPKNLSVTHKYMWAPNIMLSIRKN